MPHRPIRHPDQDQTPILFQAASVSSSDRTVTSLGDVHFSMILQGTKALEITEGMKMSQCSHFHEAH